MSSKLWFETNGVVAILKKIKFRSSRIIFKIQNERVLSQTKIAVKSQQQLINEELMDTSDYPENNYRKSLLIISLSFEWKTLN